jgi:hypothetical protein
MLAGAHTTLGMSTRQKDGLYASIRTVAGTRKCFVSQNPRRNVTRDCYVKNQGEKIQSAFVNGFLAQISYHSLVSYAHKCEVR